jgi:hypothetical protein
MRVIIKTFAVMILLMISPVCAAAPSVSAMVCGKNFSPQSELPAFTDSGITTKLWRDKISACGDALIADWWLYEGKHWAVSIRREVKNYTAKRRPPLALQAQLFIDGKRIPGNLGVIDGRFYEFQVAYMESYRLSPKFAVRDLLKQRKIPPINKFRMPIQRDYITENWAVKEYTSLGDGPLYRHMPDTGERSDIGLVGEWCANYISYWDIAADYWWKACTDQALDSGNAPWSIFGKDGRAIMWDDPEFRKFGFDPRNPAGTLVEVPAAKHFMYDFGQDYKWKSGKTEQDWILDEAHQPFVQLVPYMSTRHPYFLWLAQFQTGSLYGYLQCGFDWCGRRKTAVPTLANTQVRDAAWSFRTLTQTALMTPDVTPEWLWPKARYQPFIVASEKRWREEKIQQTHNYWLALKQNRAATLSQTDECYVVKAGTQESCVVQIWKYDYWAQAIGFAKWAGVKGLDPLNKLFNDIVVFRYERGSPVRNIGAPFLMVFASSQRASQPKAASLEDVRKFTPSENKPYGNTKPLSVGTGENIGQWTELAWQVQGNAAFCALNGDARCLDIARWWESQFKLQKEANPQWPGGWEYGKYRIAFE